MKAAQAALSTAVTLGSITNGCLRDRTSTEEKRGIGMYPVLNLAMTIRP